VREGSLRELEAAIDAAAAAGATTAVAHAETDAWRGAWGADDLRGTLHDAVERLDRYGRERGVVVCFENIPRGLFTTHDLRDLFAETEAAATLDTGHARMDGVDAGGMAAIVRDHPDRVRHVHLNDTRRAADEHLPFGAGTIDFETLFAAFPADWGGTLSLEVFTESYDYVAESLAQLRRVLDGV
jgi:sugar phosphate isomerase/epimerase